MFVYVWVGLGFFLSLLTSSYDAINMFFHGTLTSWSAPAVSQNTHTIIGALYQVFFQVWRPTGPGRYKLVGFDQIILQPENTQPIPGTSHEDDRLAYFYILNETENHSAKAMSPWHCLLPFTYDSFNTAKAMSPWHRLLPFTSDSFNTMSPWHHLLPFTSDSFNAMSPWHRLLPLVLCVEDIDASAKAVLAQLSPKLVTY